MVRADYDPGKENWDYLFIDQIGSGKYFEAARWMRGAGLGSVLSSVLRLLLPVGKVVAQEGLETTGRALTQMLNGAEPIAALKSESKKAVRKLMNRADIALKQRGIGKRQRRITVAKSLHTKRSSKRSKRDIFGNV